MLEALAIGTIEARGSILVGSVDGVSRRRAHLVAIGRSSALSTLITREARSIWGATIGTEAAGGRRVDLRDRGYDYLGAWLNVLFS